MNIIFKLTLIFMSIISLASSSEINKNKTLEKVSLQLMWKHQFEFAGFYIAKEKGFYEDLGLNVDIKEFNFETNIVDDVQSGKTTFGIGYSTVILDKLKGKDIVLLKSILQSFPHVLVSLKSTAINSLKDFKNKRIMINDGAAETASFLSMFKTENITANDFTKLKHTFDIKSLLNNDTDIISIFKSNELYHLDKMNIQYNIWDPKDYGFDFYNDILYTSKKQILQNPKKVDNFVHASLRGWNYAFENIEETVDLILKKYNTQNKSRDALLYEAKVLKELAFVNQTELGNINKNKIQRIADIYSLMGLTNKSIDLDEFIYEVNDLHLTSKETSFIKNNHIKCVSTTSWAPFNGFDKTNSKPAGIAFDYWDIIAKKVNLKQNCEELNNWNEVLNSIKNKKADITISAAITDDRKEYALFTKPYVSFPIAIATRNDFAYIPNISLLNGKKVAVGNNFSAHKLLMKKYPKIDFVPVENLNKALNLLSTGKVYAVADVLPVIAHNMNKSQYTNLKISGTTNFNLDIRMMVRNDMPELVSIINKAIDSISEDQKKLIYNRWVSINFVKGYDYTTLLFLILFFLVIILLLTLWQMSIKKKNQELLKTKENLDETLKSFKSLINSTLEGIIVFKNNKCIDSNDVILDILSYESKEEILGKDIFSFVSKESYDMVNESLENKNTHPFEITLINKNNEPIICLFRVKDLILNGKRLKVAAIIDLTNLKEKENVIFQQSKMVALGEMIGNIAHQWRQPLSVISVLSSGMYINRKMGLLNEDELIESLQKINKTASELSNTIETFRDFLREDKTSHVVSLDSVIQRVLFLEESIIKKSFIEVDTKLDESINIQTFKNELEEVFMIIINNASDQFSVNKTDKPKLEIETFTKNEYGVIKISDNAGGVPTNIIDRIFEPYFTTKHKSTGTGLGLHIAYRIITESLGGTIKVKNHKNGACFIIEIPLFKG